MVRGLFCVCAESIGRRSSSGRKARLFSHTRMDLIELTSRALCRILFSIHNYHVHVHPYISADMGGRGHLDVTPRSAYTYTAPRTFNYFRRDQVSRPSIRAQE